jgi:alkylresorcinol/alkylpyrone synthase
MSYIASTASCLPSNYYPQDHLIKLLRRFWVGQHSNLERLERIQRNTTVKGRHLALPLEKYQDLTSFDKSNRAWTAAALDLGEQTIRDLLGKTGLEAGEIAHLLFTTVTGIAVPSIDARLMNRLPFNPALKRSPLFGLGCLGGAAGVARAADYLAGHPDEAAILLSIELCSLTLQREDTSIENIVASGLFGDGSAAVLLVGDRHPKAGSNMPKIVDSRSVFFPHSEHIMGWDVRASGLKVVLSADVAEVAEREIRPALEAFLSAHRLKLKDIAHWIAHPGGPKVIEALEKGLDLKEDALRLSRDSLAQVGNISSTSILLILQDTLEKCQPEPGSYGVMLAMGPAFCAEFVLLKW